MTKNNIEEIKNMARENHRLRTKLARKQNEIDELKQKIVEFQLESFEAGYESATEYCLKKIKESKHEL